MTRRIALYARVSTGEQTPDPQLDALREYAERRGFEAVEYVDHGVSGAKAKRPALDQLMAAARRRNIDAVACVKLDRLARSVHHLVTLGVELETLAVDLIVLDQAIDTSTPAGRFTFHILGAVAELERDLIRERTRAGMQAAKRHGTRSGRAIGRPRAIRGPDTFRLERMLAQNHSLRSIGRTLGVSASTVKAEARRLAATMGSG